MILSETAYAKLNLALHVRRRRADGYHELETLFAFCEDGDVVTAEPADEISMTIDGPFADGLPVDDHNLVIRAANALQAAAGVTQGARLLLIKNLPIASGIGGGSADAAAALGLLGRLWGLEFDNAALALKLGADVPACLLSQSARGEGVGERLTPLGDGFKGAPVLLVHPRIALSTAAVFKGWNGLDRGALTQGNNLLAIVSSARNDLTAPACHLAPVIADVLAALERQSGTSLVRMSGSGATCFALFKTIEARDTVRADIASTYPHWWTLASRLR